MSAAALLRAFLAALVVAAAAAAGAPASAQAVSELCRGLDEPTARQAALAAEEMPPIETYLKCFTDGDGAFAVRAHLLDLRERLACRSALASDDVDALRRFMIARSDTECAAQVLTRLRQLEADTQERASSARAAAERVAAACRQALAGNDKAALERLLAEYRDAPCAADARARIASFDAAAQAARAAAERTRQRQSFAGYGNTALRGTVARTGGAPSQEVCLDACIDSREACQGITYTTATRVCALYSAVAGREPRGGVTAYSRTPVALPTPPAVAARPPVQPDAHVLQQPSFAPAQTLPGIDLPSGDIRQIDNITMEGCAAACNAMPQCRAMTFNRRFNACFLKDRVVRQVPHREAVSWIKGAPLAAPTRPGESVPLHGIDLPQGDLSRLDNSNFAECQTTCMETKACRAVTFNARNGACFLKSAITAFRPDPNAISWIK